MTTHQLADPEPRRPGLFKRTRRRTRSENGARDSVSEDGSGGGAALEWTAPAAWFTKVLAGLLYLALLTGPIALAGLIWMSNKPVVVTGPEQAGGDEAAVASQRAAVSAFAEEYVVAWLSTARGSEKSLAAYLPGYASVTLPQTPATVANPAVSSVEAVPDSQDTATAAGREEERPAGSWTATVAVDVRTSAKAAAVRRYFQVPISWQSGALVAQALPAPVPAPAIAEDPETAYADSAALQDPLASSIAEFFKAFLTGNGDVTRYITPDAPIRAVTPAPYAEVEIDEVQTDRDLTDVDQNAPADGERLRVLVTAAGTSAAQQSISLQYSLTVTARANRWEVTSIDPGPLLSTSSADGGLDGSPSSSETAEVPNQDPVTPN